MRKTTSCADIKISSFYKTSKTIIRNTYSLHMIFFRLTQVNIAYNVATNISLKSLLVR